jgi:hypothetical protein
MVWKWCGHFWFLRFLYKIIGLKNTFCKRRLRFPRANMIYFGSRNRMCTYDLEAPSPAEKPGIRKMSSIRTHLRSCPFCEAACGVEVTADHATRAILHVKGDKSDPFSQGFICPKSYGMTVRALVDAG